MIVRTAIGVGKQTRHWRDREGDDNREIEKLKILSPKSYSVVQNILLSLALLSLLWRCFEF